MKQRTKKAAQKRFHLSAKGVVKHRKTGQSHFNARATGNTTRKKHGYQRVHANDRKRLEKLIPHN
jgi:ribosomal protein L35